MSRAIIYSRTSTVEQSVANQLLQLRQWAQQRNLEIVAEYVEQESAWKAGHQRELHRLLKDAERRGFDVVLTWSLDRLSRQGPLAILSLINRLARHGCKVISLQESWTEAPGEIADLLYSLTGWVARMESQRKSERTLAGLARSKAQAADGRLPTRGPDKKKRKKRRLRGADNAFY